LSKQRYKIYKIEEDYNPPSTTPEAMQMWFDWVVKTKFWRDRSKVKHVKVVFPVVGKMSGATKDGPHLAKIDFGVFSLNQLSACHELAHILTWDAEADDEGDHGPRFVGMYLETVKRFYGAEQAKLLQKDFDEKGVKYTGGGI